MTDKQFNRRLAAARQRLKAGDTMAGQRVFLLSAPWASLRAGLRTGNDDIIFEALAMLDSFNLRSKSNK